MDIVERMRNYDIDCHCVERPDPTVMEAANEIERLRKIIIKITHHIDDNQSWLFIKTFALAALKEGE